MRLACPTCQIEMRPARVGVGVETMSTEGPYELYMADLYECPDCHTQILGGFPEGPLTAHYEPGYKGRLARFEGKLFHCWKNANERQLFQDRAERAS